MKLTEYEDNGQNNKTVKSQAANYGSRVFKKTQTDFVEIVGHNNRSWRILVLQKEQIVKIF